MAYFFSMTTRAYLLLGFFIILFVTVSVSHAETIASTAQNTIVSDEQISWGASADNSCATLGIPEKFAVWASACQCIVDIFAQSFPGTVSHPNNIDGDGNCYGLRPEGQVPLLSSMHKALACAVGSSWNGFDCVTQTYSCPAGYAISADGLSCSRPDCPPGTERNQAGDCVSPCPAAGDARHNGKEVSVSDAIQPQPTSACIDGCAYSLGSAGGVCIGLAGETANTCYAKVGTSLNRSCGSTDYLPVFLLPAPTPTKPDPVPEENNQAAPGSAGVPQPAPATSEESCIAKGMGYITMSGITSCVPNGSGMEKTVSNEVNTKTNPDGSSVKTETKTKKNGDGSVEESVTTKTYDAAGNQTGVSTTVSNSNGVDAYCKQNPTAPLCAKSETSGGGTCESAPTCKGDAVSCAILRQQWEARCEAKKTNTALGEGSTRAAELAGVGEGAMNGQPYDRSANTENIDVSGQISTAKFLSGGCISDKVITGLPMGKTVTIPFSELCPYLEIFGNVMVIVSMLAAARIVGVF